MLPLGDALQRPAGIPEREPRTGADGAVRVAHEGCRPAARIGRAVDGVALRFHPSTLGQGSRSHKGTQLRCNGREG